MPSTAVTVRVPATSANLGAGFDCLGLALDLFASITVKFGDTEQEPTNDVGEKMVLTAIRATYSRLDRTPPAGISASYGVSIPLGRGMGASAVARVAGALAANEFEGRPLSREECMAVAADLEGHGDNACPAMFGGVQVCVTDNGRYLHVPARFPADATIAILIPDHSMATKDARKVVPDSFSKEDAVHNVGRAALFVAALSAGRFDLLDAATDDRFHQRQRASLFPPLFDIFGVARAACAHAAWLSGAGSCVAAFCSEESGRPVAAAMLQKLQESGMAGRTLVTRISRTGAEVARVELVED